MKHFQLSYEIKKHANTKTRQGVVVFRRNHCSGVFGHTGESKGSGRIRLLVVSYDTVYVLVDSRPREDRRQK
jgi:hypothetical protein